MKQRDINRGFIKFVMFKILNTNGMIENTFILTSKIREEIESPITFQAHIDSFINNINSWITEDCSWSKEKIRDKLINTSLDEFMLVHKQDRVDITIEVEQMFNK